MKASSVSSQAGMISLIVLTVTSIFLLSLSVVATASELGPFVCLLARALGLPPLAD